MDNIRWVVVVVGFGKLIWRCARVASGTLIQTHYRVTFKQQIFIIFIVEYSFQKEFSKVVIFFKETILLRLEISVGNF